MFLQGKAISTAIHQDVIKRILDWEVFFPRSAEGRWLHPQVIMVTLHRGKERRIKGTKAKR
jgi:hypothetical protein